MRIVAALVLGLVAAATPASAQERFERNVGTWRVAGENGDCTAATIGGSDSTLLLIVSPASSGENLGAISIGNQNWKIQDHRAVITLKGDGPWARDWAGSAASEIYGYWLPFRGPTEADQFPDSFTLDAYEGTRQIANMPITGYKAALTTLRQCASETMKR